MLTYKHTIWKKIIYNRSVLYIDDGYKYISNKCSVYFDSWILIRRMMHNEIIFLKSKRECISFRMHILMNYSLTTLINQPTEFVNTYVWIHRSLCNFKTVLAKNLVALSILRYISNLKLKVFIKFYSFIKYYFNIF